MSALVDSRIRIPKEVRVLGRAWGRLGNSFFTIKDVKEDVGKKENGVPFGWKNVSQLLGPIHFGLGGGFAARRK